MKGSLLLPLLCGGSGREPGSILVSRIAHLELKVSTQAVRLEKGLEEPETLVKD
jgi:hypothetical protein